MFKNRYFTRSKRLNCRFVDGLNKLGRGVQELERLQSKIEQLRSRNNDRKTNSHAQSASNQQIEAQSGEQVYQETNVPYKNNNNDLLQECGQRLSDKYANYNAQSSTDTNSITDSVSSINMSVVNTNDTLTNSNGKISNNSGNSNNNSSANTRYKREQRVAQIKARMVQKLLQVLGQFRYWVMCQHLEGRERVCKQIAVLSEIKTNKNSLLQMICQQMQSMKMPQHVHTSQLGTMARLYLLYCLLSTQLLLHFNDQTDLNKSPINNKPNSQEQSQSTCTSSGTSSRESIRQTTHRQLLTKLVQSQAMLKPNGNQPNISQSTLFEVD